MKTIFAVGVAVAWLATSACAWAQNRPATQPARPAPAQPAPGQPGAAQPAAGQPSAGPATATAPVDAAQSQARVSGWAARCVTAARAAPPECTVEQSMVRISNGQVVMTFIVRFAPDSRAPLLQVQVPLSVFLPGGLKLRTDTGVGLDLAYQTCDQRGCFVGNPVSPEFLTALKAAKRIEATVQSMAREAQVLSMPMDGFAAAYDRVQ